MKTLSVWLPFCYVNWIYSHLMKWPIFLILAALAPGALGAELPAAARFRKNARPILEKYCSDCHLDGMNKGGVAFDEFKSDDALLAKHDLWQAVLKNTRAGLMPPAKKPQPSPEEPPRLGNGSSLTPRHQRNPDPGRVTARRLNGLNIATPFATSRALTSTPRPNSLRMTPAMASTTSATCSPCRPSSWKSTWTRPKPLFRRRCPPWRA